MKKVIVFGEALIDFIPKQKGMLLKEVQDFQRCAGGAPANVAACVGKLGGNVAFIGQIGDDAFGRHIHETLQENQVETSNLLVSKEYPTALAFVTLTASGEREFIFYRKQSADLMLNREDIDDQLFDSGSIFHLGSNLFMYEPAYQLSRSLVKLAKSKGLLVSYDPNLRPLLWPEQKIDMQKINSIIPDVDILKVSEEELHYLVDDQERSKTIFEQVEKIGQLGPKLILVTLGNKGCYFSLRTSSNEVIEGLVESYPIETVDTTGAGDAFMGAFLYKLSTAYSSLQALQRAELVACCQFANACGAIATSKAGAINALPLYAELEQLLASF